MALFIHRQPSIQPLLSFPFIFLLDFQHSNRQGFLFILAMNRNVLSASSIFPLLAKYIGESGIHTNKTPNKINGDTVAPNKVLHELFGKIVHANNAETMLPNDQKNSNDDKYTPLFLLGKNSAHKLYATGTPPNPKPTTILAKHNALKVGASADPTPANNVNPVEHLNENNLPFLSANIPKLGAPKPIPRNTKTRPNSTPASSLTATRTSPRGL